MLEAQSEGSRGVGGLAVGQRLDAPLGQQAEGEQVGHINHPHLTPRTRGRPPDHPGFMMIRLINSTVPPIGPWEHRNSTRKGPVARRLQHCTSRRVFRAPG